MTLHLTDDEARMVREFVDAVTAMIRPGHRETERHELGRTKLALVSVKAMLDAKAADGKPSQGEGRTSEV